MATISYTINKSTLYALVDAEVSLAADEAYADDGTSLYESVSLFSKDKSLVEQRIDDAVDDLVRKCSDICKYGSGAITFDVADFDSTNNATAAGAAITRYIALSVITSFLQTRRVSIAPQYIERTKDALENVISIVRTRTAPSRI